MTHGALHLFYVKRKVAVHHQLDGLALRSKPLDANILESAIGDGSTHLLELIAGESMSHEVVVRIWTLLHAGFNEFLNGGTDDLVGDLVVLADQFLQGLLPGSACATLVFIPGHEQ